MNTGSRLSALALILSVLTLSGCSGADPHEALMVESIEVFKELNQTMAGITDQASAEAAKPELEAIATRLEAIDKSYNELGVPSAKREKELREQYDAMLEEATGDMIGHMMRVSMNPEIAQVIEPIFDDFQPAME